MPEWSDNVILLSSKPFGETGMLVSVFSEKNGRYKSLVYGGNSIKSRATFQKGNLCDAYWKARIPDQMGSIKLELLNSTASSLLNNPMHLSALSSICEISDYILPERETNATLYDATIKLFKVLKMSDDQNFSWIKGYINWEIGLLSELGFSLNLNKCAVNGDNKNLAFVSPKTGRAVSYEVGLPYKNKLLILPNFLGGNYMEMCPIKDLLQGLCLTKFFLELNFYKYKNIPSCRLRFEQQLEKKLSKV